VAFLEDVGTISHVIVNITQIPAKFVNKGGWKTTEVYLGTLKLITSFISKNTRNLTLTNVLLGI
jgi:hypothetical protein